MPGGRFVACTECAGTFKSVGSESVGVLDRVGSNVAVGACVVAAQLGCSAESRADGLDWDALRRQVRRVADARAGP
jgi:hypothetical protein